MKARRSVRGPVQDAGVALLLVAVVGAAAFAFAWPWLPEPVPGGEQLAQYAPVAHGRAQRYVLRDTSGTVQVWRSENQAVLLSGRGLAGDLRPAPREALRTFLARPGEATLSDDVFLERLQQVQLVEITRRDLKANGQLRNEVHLQLRDHRGAFLISIYDPADDQDLVYAPPVLLLPARLEPGASWISEGVLAGTFTYKSRGTVLETGTFGQGRDRLEDCRKIETGYAFSHQGRIVEHGHSLAWHCPGVGLVDEQGFDSTGAPIDHLQQVLPGVTLAAAVDFPVFPVPPLPSAGETDPWRIARMGRIGKSLSYDVAGSAPPLWIPGDPPALLVPGTDGVLTAFDAGDPSGRVLWRFQAGGPLFSSPAYDALSHRIFFGTGDKRLIALDARGLFLWSFETGDNVPTRPLVLDSLVVFGSEDRNLYFLHAETGMLQGQFSTEGPIASSPGQAAGLVIFGSDDGAVYGVDLKTRKQRWRFATESAVEAPIVISRDTVFVASRDGNLYALHAASGSAYWTGRAGRVLRVSPAVGSDQVFVVDDEYRLVAFDRATGRRRWTTVEAVYVGTPVLVSDGLLIAGHDGSVYRLGYDGVQQERWAAAEASIATDGPPAFEYGPVAGGGMLWLVDRRGVVRRFYRADEEQEKSSAEALLLSWTHPVSSAPFQRYLISASPVVFGGQALVLDQQANMYRVHPETGRVEHTGWLNLADRSVVQEPVVQDSMLLVVAGNTLHAFHLPDGKVRWQFTRDESVLHPPVVAGTTVLWLTERSEPDDEGRLYALDLTTGRLLWQESLPKVYVAGSVAVQGNTVFTSTPPAAFDLATGSRRWQADLEGVGEGGPGLSLDGDVLFTTLLIGPDPGRADSCAVFALDAATGTLRWRTTLPGEGLHIFDRLWVSDETLVFPSIYGSLIGLDVHTGAERWRYTPDSPRFGLVTVTHGQVWTALQSGHVVVLDAGSGRVIARYSDMEQKLGAYSLFQRPVIMGRAALLPTGTALLGFKTPSPR